MNRQPTVLMKMRRVGELGLFFNNQDIANAGVTEKAVLYLRSRFSWELSEIGAAKPDGARLLREAPAAFGRLCVETGQWFI